MSTGHDVTYKCGHLIETMLASREHEVCLQQLLHSIVVNLRFIVLCQKPLDFLNLHEELSREGIPMWLELESWLVKILGTDSKVSSTLRKEDWGEVGLKVRSDHDCRKQDLQHPVHSILASASSARCHVCSKSIHFKMTGDWADLASLD